MRQLIPLVSGLMLVTFGLLVLLSSCGDETCGPGDQEIKRTSPEALVSALAQSFESKSPSLYAECLASDFIFEFTHQDAEFLGLALWNPIWSRDEDTTAVSKMLSDPAIKSIVFDYSILPTHLGKPRNPSRVILNVSPEITMVYETEGDQWVNVIDHIELELALVREPKDADQWVIERMVESYTIIPGLSGWCTFVNGGLHAVEPTSLGMVKSLYCKPTPKGDVSLLLDTYCRSCSTKDLELYDNCLGHNYRFIFLPEVADTLDLPPPEPWWSKPMDLDAMDNLFSSGQVTSIEFDYTVVSADTLEKADSVVVKMRIQPDFELIITSDGEPSMYRINQTYLDFRFGQRSWEEGSGPWMIVETKEMHISAVATADEVARLKATPLSYSELKAMFRSE